MSEREKLLRNVRKYDFALYDLMLYLDTHPDCREAAALYAEYREKREQEVRAYTKQFGAMQALQTNTDTRWSWNVGPYPWEKEAN